MQPSLPATSPEVVFHVDRPSGRDRPSGPQWASPTMAGPTVRVHDGMTLNALAAAVRTADIRLCLTVTEHFGWNGLGDTIAFCMLPLKFALAHEPHLRYQFAPIGTHGEP